MNTKLNSKKILLVIFVIFIIAIFWRFSSVLYFPDSSITLRKGQLVKLQPGEAVTQKFTASRNGLSKMEILLRSPGVRYENGDRMEMEILDENCNEKVRSGELKKSFTNDDNLHEFVFPRISDSAGRNYCLKATFSPTKITARAIQFFTLAQEENSPYSIRPAYKNAYVWQDLSELNQRISQYKPFFLKHYYLWFASIGFVVISVGLVIILIAI